MSTRPQRGTVLSPRISRRQFLTAIGSAILGCAASGGKSYAIASCISPETHIVEEAITTSPVLCKGDEVEFTTPAFPDLADNVADITNQVLIDLWNSMPLNDQAAIRYLFNPFDGPLKVFHPESFFDSTSVGSLEEVRRPSFFQSESIRYLDEHTYLVELLRPRDGYEEMMIASDPNGYPAREYVRDPQTGNVIRDSVTDEPLLKQEAITWQQIPETVKLRGWYIRGSGIVGQDNDHGTDDAKHALVIFWLGRGDELTDTTNPELPPTRELIAHFVHEGFDVLALDERGTGVSTGYSSLDNEMMADDTFAALEQLQSGEGLTTVGPDGIVRSGSEAIGLLPDLAEKVRLLMWGHSQGTLIGSWVMTKHIIDPEYRNFDLKGYISSGGFDIFPAMAFAPFIGGNGYYQAELQNTFAVPDPSIVYANMADWPGYCTLRGFADPYNPVESGVIAYNRVRGYKEVYALPVGHGVYRDPDYFAYTTRVQLRFARKAALKNKVKLNNTQQTTVEKEVCRGYKLNSDKHYLKPIPGCIA
jgi:pimeloyl-ACP methyl ester carboxylesterase